MGNKKRVVQLWLSLWPLTHFVKRISSYTPFRQLFSPLLKERLFDVTFIPINEDIPPPENVMLPRQVLRELVKASSHRFIYDGCICRKEEECENYPRDLGCLFLGEAAAHLHPSLGHRAGIEESLEHIEKMAEAGLTGMIGRIWMDATVLGVLRNFGRFLVVCFCCDCCCVVRTDLRKASPELKAGIKRLQAVRVSITDKCRGCGTCASNCFVAAINLRDGRAVIDQAACKACGRCSSLCPQEAIEVDFDREGQLMRELFSRVESAIAID
jgi:ferredoxin